MGDASRAGVTGRARAPHVRYPSNRPKARSPGPSRAAQDAIRSIPLERRHGLCDARLSEFERVGLDPGGTRDIELARVPS
jgi:hypothetical protein